MKRKFIEKLTALSLSVITVTAVTPVIQHSLPAHAEEVVVNRPHFENGYVEIDGLKYHKISDTTVAVNKGLDFNCNVITIPSQISVDDVRFTVTTIEAEAFKGEVIDDVKGTCKPYKATQIIIPSSVRSLGASCFYSLENIQSLDISQIRGDDGTTLIHPSSAYDLTSALTFSSTAKVDRIKLPHIAYKAQRVQEGLDRICCYRTYTNTAFIPVVYTDINSSVISQWYIKPSVRVNEVQDYEKKDGYTFGGWQSKTNICDGYGSYDVTYTQYSPTYEEKQPLWDFEDKFKANLANAVLSKNSTQADIEKLIKASLTFDNISYEIKDFRNVPPDWDVKGAVRCTVQATNTLNDESISINVDRYTTSIIRVEILDDIFKEIEISDDITKDKLIQSIENKLGDNGLKVDIENYKNTGSKITGTVTVTDTTTGDKVINELNKVIEGKLEDAVTDALNDIAVNNSTTEKGLLDELTQSIGDPEIQLEIQDFKNENGTVTGTIVSKDSNGNTTTLSLDKKIPSRTQTLEELKPSVEDKVSSIKVTSTTTEQDLMKYVSEIVTDPSIEVSIKDFKNDNGEVTGTIVLKDVDSKEHCEISIATKSTDNLVQDAIKDIPVDSNTTDIDILSSLADSLEESGLMVDIKDFKNDGKTITGVVLVTDSSGNCEEVQFTREVVEQTVEEVQKIIQKNLVYFKPSDSSTLGETIKALSKGIVDAGVDITIPDFSNKDGKMSGTITITKADGTTGTILLDKTVSSSTDTPSTNTPSTNTPSTNTPSTNTPSTNTPSTNTPSTSTPSTNTPSTNTPSTNTPSTNTGSAPSGNQGLLSGTGSLTNAYNTTNSNNTTDSHDSTSSKDTNIDGDKNKITTSKDDNSVEASNDADNSIDISNNNDIAPVYNISNCTIYGNIGNLSNIGNTSNVSPNNSMSLVPGSYLDGEYYNSKSRLNSQKGWQQDTDGLWYYLDKTTGAMKTGWFYDNGNWYYLKEISDGTKGSMQTGWQKINGNWYYLYEDGTLAQDTLIDGYRVDGNGVCIY